MVKLTSLDIDFNDTKEKKKEKIIKSAKKFGEFFASTPGAGVRTAFGGKAPKKKKGKKKDKTTSFRAKGPLAESPGNILVDKKPRDLFRRWIKIAKEKDLTKKFAEFIPASILGITSVGIIQQSSLPTPIKTGAGGLIGVGLLKGLLK